MARANLRKVGGSVMLAIPPAILDQLSLGEGTGVELAVEGEALVVRSRRPRYTLEQLLAEEEAALQDRASDRPGEEWSSGASVGDELI